MSDDEILARPVNDEGAGVERADVVRLTRARLDDRCDPGDDEIWQAWEQVGGGGPTVGDDIGRVVAQIEGIAVDG